MHIFETYMYKTLCPSSTYWPTQKNVSPHNLAFQITSLLRLQGVHPGMQSTSLTINKKNTEHLGGRPNHIIQYGKNLHQTSIWGYAKRIGHRNGFNHKPIDIINSYATRTQTTANRLDSSRVCFEVQHRILDCLRISNIRRK